MLASADRPRAAGFTRPQVRNGADGISDIEGKVTRVGASECGQRASFKIAPAKILQRRRLATAGLGAAHPPRDKVTYLLPLMSALRLDPVYVARIPCGSIGRGERQSTSVAICAVSAIIFNG